MEKREEVHSQVLSIEQTALRVAAEAAFVVSLLFQSLGGLPYRALLNCRIVVLELVSDLSFFKQHEQNS